MRSPRLMAGIAVFIVAFLLRILYLQQMAASPFFDFLQLDPLYYYQWAERIAAGDWLGTEVFEMSPLYSYLLAVYLKIVGPDLWLLRILQVSVGSVTCVLTWLLGRRLFGARAGLIAGLGCAFYGPFFFYEGQVMKEFLTPPLATGALILLLAARPEGEDGAPDEWRPIPLLAAGCLLALAALVRDNFLLLLALMGGWLILESRKWLPPALLAAGALAILAPVGVRNYVAGGDLVLTTAGGGEVFYIGNGPYANGAYVPPPWVRSNPRFEHEDFRAKARELAGRDLSRAEASHFWWRQGLEWIGRNPGKAARLWLRKFALFWNDHELPDNYSYDTFRRFSPLLSLLLTFGPAASLAWCGLVLTSSSWRRLMPVYLAGAGYMISVLLFFNFARFRLPLVPILLAFAGAALAGLWKAVTRWRATRRVSGRAIASLIVLVCATFFMRIDWSSAAEEPFQDRLHLGAAYRQAGRPEEAERVFREAIDDAEALVRRHGGDPSRPETVPGGITFLLALGAVERDLGDVLMDQGRHEEAVEAYRKAARLSPKDAGLQLRLAAALRAAGRTSEAERALRTAVGLDPESFVARFDLANLYHDTGRLDDALKELRRARDLIDESRPLDLADYHYATGAVLYVMGGRDEEAARHFRRALELNPDSPQAPQVREALEQMGLRSGPPPPGSSP